MKIFIICLDCLSVISTDCRLPTFYFILFFFEKKNEFCCYWLSTFATIINNFYQDVHLYVLIFFKVIDFIVIESRSENDEDEDVQNNHATNGLNKGEPDALVVLAEEELVVIDLQSKDWKMINLPYLVSLHASAVTCSQHVSGMYCGRRGRRHSNFEMLRGARRVLGATERCRKSPNEQHLLSQTVAHRRRQTSVFERDHPAQGIIADWPRRRHRPLLGRRRGHPHPHL